MLRWHAGAEADLPPEEVRVEVHQFFRVNIAWLTEVFQSGRPSKSSARRPGTCAGRELRACWKAGCWSAGPPRPGAAARGQGLHGFRRVAPGG